MATPEPYREALRRAHRLLGVYASLWCWTHRVDAIALPREQLLPFLGLERMRNDRIDWLKSDVKDFFPHAWATVFSRSGNYATLYLSRYQFPAKGKEGYMDDEDRAKRFSELGLKCVVAKVPREAVLMKRLSMLAHGIGRLKARGT
jgi:hypothetical protein